MVDQDGVMLTKEILIKGVKYGFQDIVLYVLMIVLVGFIQPPLLCHIRPPCARALRCCAHGVYASHGSDALFRGWMIWPFWRGWGT